MKQMDSLGRKRRVNENGQTLALVAVSLVALLAMAALAIDLTSLYAAKGEIQRTADAAALAGAKAFVDSGITTDPGNSSLQNIAQTMARNYASGAAAQNLVAGGSATLAGSPAVDFSIPGDPRITVTVRRTGLPLFFARIWGGSFGSVSATAVAEAYNPAFSQSNTNSFLPTAPKCVKPLLIPNEVPAPLAPAGTRFVDVTSGMVNSGVGQFLGQQITFKSDCNNGGGNGKGNGSGNGKGSNKGGGCTLQDNPPKRGEYLAMLAGTSHQYCPSASALGCSGAGSDFEQSVECCDGSAFNYQQCGTGSALASWDPSVDTTGGGQGQNASPVQAGLQCLIHTTPGNSQQDSIDTSAFDSGNGPVFIAPGTFSQSRYGIPATALMGTSDSIITVPLFDNTSQLPANGQVTIVGFLTLFVVDANGSKGNGSGNGGDFDAVILNVSGCGNAPAAGAAVSGGGVSAIPVRLVHN